MRRLCWSIFWSFTLACALASSAQAQQKAQKKTAEYLVPASTKGFLVVPDVQALGNSWDRIALGRLAADPRVKPFIEDLREQVQTRLDQTGIRIGLSIGDLMEVCSGEVAIGFVLPKSGAQRHAVTAIAEIEDKAEAVKKMRETIRVSMKERGATRQVKQVGGVEMEVFTIPVKKDSKKTFKAVFFENDDRLVAVDHEGIAAQILGIMQGRDENVLAKHTPYIKTMNRCTKEAKGLVPHLKWFVEPLGYASIAREAAAIQRNKRSDILAALEQEGFDAVKGAGGYINLDVGKLEILSRSFVFAPPVPGAGDERYEKAARILAFPGNEELEIQPWVPKTISSYVTASWDIKKAYNYIGSLVDAIAGAEGFWEDLKASLLEDPNGPQIDLDEEIVAHLGSRATIITDCEVPVTPKSERFLVAISLKNAEAMTLGIKKMFEMDPGAEKHEYDGIDIWVTIDEEAEAPVVAIEGDFNQFNFGDDDAGAADDTPPLMTNTAIAVVEGNLMISSHKEFIVDIIRRDKTEKSIDADKDYQDVMAALATLGSTGKDTARLFSRTDEELQATYELIREGRMPESEGLLGSLLNQMFGPKEKGVIRDQRIDSEKMPKYEVVRPYLSPIGVFLSTEDDGWYGAGIALKNAALADVVPAAREASLSNSDRADSK